MGNNTHALALPSYHAPSVRARLDFLFFLLGLRLSLLPPLTSPSLSRTVDCVAVFAALPSFTNLTTVALCSTFSYIFAAVFNTTARRHFAHQPATQG